jgi:2-succinyl-5-enolpyruvyl-6-hydroxy-3-cyclohexene-1-carboxylate synthase
MSVASAEIQATFCATLFDEFARSGLRHVVVCPGSRSTPLALAAASSDLALHVRLDERSAGFFALGLARATGQAVPIVVTSGTAVAELSAAVIEASLDRVPLIVLSADRPIELHQRGSAQTVTQAGCFDRHAVFSIDVQAPAAMDATQWRPLASRLVLESSGVSGTRGVAHVNLGLVEPLVTPAGIMPEGRRDGGAWLRATPLGPERRTLQDLAARRILILGGGAFDDAAIASLVSSTTMPILADPRSGARRFGAASVICAADAIVRSPRSRRELQPDQILIVGGPPASKELSLWIEACAQDGTSLITVGPDGPSRFPWAVSVEHRKVATLNHAVALISGDPTPVDEAFSHLWQEAERIVQGALHDICQEDSWSEPAVVRALSQHLGDDEVLVASSSMPIRDLEWFGGPCQALVASNRGANGIDGVVSTAFGMAAAGKSVTCLVGDLAFLYDVSALVDGITHKQRVRIVVLDNRGGAIFSFLPQRRSVAHETFEQLFGTPPQVDIVRVAQGFGLSVTEVTSGDSLAHALAKPIEGLEVLVCRLPDRDHNVIVHDEIQRRIIERLG